MGGRSESGSCGDSVIVRGAKVGGKGAGAAAIDGGVAGDAAWAITAKAQGVCSFRFR